MSTRIFRDQDSTVAFCAECETLRHHLKGRPLCGDCAKELRETAQAAESAYEEMKAMYEEMADRVEGPVYCKACKDEL